MVVGEKARGRTANEATNRKRTHPEIQSDDRLRPRGGGFRNATTKGKKNNWVKGNPRGRGRGTVVESVSA